MRNELVKACHRTDNPLHIAWFWLLLLLCFLRGGRWEVRCPVVLLLHHGSHLRLAWCFRLCRSLSQHWYLRCRDSFDPCLISHLLQLLASLRVGRLHLSRHTGQILLIFCLALVQAVTLHLRIFICLSRLFVFCIFLHRSVKLFLIFILLLSFDTKLCLDSQFCSHAIGSLHCSLDVPSWILDFRAFLLQTFEDRHGLRNAKAIQSPDNFLQLDSLGQATKLIQPVQFPGELLYIILFTTSLVFCLVPLCTEGCGVDVLDWVIQAQALLLHLLQDYSGPWTKSVKGSSNVAELDGLPALLTQDTDKARQCLEIGSRASSPRLVSTSGLGSRRPWDRCRRSSLLRGQAD
mmetsp:Transcript_98672/g.170839  ORF Transcript_98672/g.170839 Transcript_98672/m.170839 type:complete len:348 (+) Transcript_98672:671-1714(+)